MKFANNKYSISKKYAQELEQKREVFADATKTRKTIFITMVTTHGVDQNVYFKKLVQNELTMHNLFN